MASWYRLARPKSPGIRVLLTVSSWEFRGKSRLVVRARGIHGPGKGKRSIFKA